MPFSHPVAAGDRLTILSNQPRNPGGYIGVSSHGRCYPVHTVMPLAVGREITLTEVSDDLDTPWSTDDPELKLDIGALIIYKYGWVAHSEAEGYLWSRDGELRRAGYSGRDNGAGYHIADLKPEIYVRFAFSECRNLTPIVIHMTHNGPEETAALTIALRKQVGLTDDD